VKLTADRRSLAAAVLVCWAIGLVWLVRRRHDVSDSARLAQGVLRLEPGTYFYTVYQTGEPIGWASSSLDTGSTGFTSREAVRVRALIAGDSQTVVASSTAHLTRAFELDTFALSVNGDEHPFRVRQTPPAGSRVLVPSLAPIAIMLTRKPSVGASTIMSIYNPISRRVERVTLGIAAESLFTVVDSAAFDTAQHRWAAAHTDTVRSWEIVPPSRAVSAWVDSRGRLVAASEPGGLSIMRSTYELATLNPKLDQKPTPKLPKH
jgi:hypothetical protein